jgi:hypothetical protein
LSSNQDSAGSPGLLRAKQIPGTQRPQNKGVEQFLDALLFIEKEI